MRAVDAGGPQPFAAPASFAAPVPAPAPAPSSIMPPSVDTWYEDGVRALNARLSELASLVGDPSAGASSAGELSELSVSEPSRSAPPGSGSRAEDAVDEHPTDPDRAMGIVAELKGSASLFAAFAFGASSPLSSLRSRSPL